MDKTMLETALLRMAKEHGVERVITMEMEPAVAKGENYSSDILRVRSKVVLGNGRMASRTFILKRLPQNKGTAEELKRQQAFQIEINIYTVVLKEMEYLMNEFGDIQEPLWCNLIHYEPYTSFLLEDLKSFGYQSVKRDVGMDLDHALLAARALGRYHGMAKVLEMRDIIVKDYFKPNIAYDERYRRIMFYPALQNLVKGIQQHWGPEWNSVAEKLNITFEEFLERVNKSLTSEESDFKVLNHGDCWSNNIMFRYDWQMRPISVRFVDFQVPHYGTPCMDFSNLIYLSVQSMVRRENYQYILENYHDSLINTVSKFSYKGSKPCLEEIFSVMERLSIYWKYTFACWYPMLTADPSEIFDIEKIVNKEGEEGFNTEVFKRAMIKERLGPDLIDLTL